MSIKECLYVHFYIKKAKMTGDFTDITVGYLSKTELKYGLIFFDFGFGSSSG